VKYCSGERRGACPAGNGGRKSDCQAGIHLSELVIPGGSNVRPLQRLLLHFEVWITPNWQGWCCDTGHRPIPMAKGRKSMNTISGGHYG